MSGFGERLRALLFPPKCAACGKLLDWYAVGNDPRALCGDCLEKWGSVTRETCGVCAKPVGECLCLTDELKKSRAAAFLKLAYYSHGKGEAVQNRVIYHIKRTRDIRTAAWLAEMLCVPLAKILSEQRGKEVLLTYLPRGRRAKLESGTDQAEAIAKALSVASKIPMARLLRRLRGGRAQKTLSAAERVRYAKEAFRLTKNAETYAAGKVIVLIDDIVTTGAGMAACVRLLRKAGAVKVYCLAVASDDVNRDVSVPVKK